MTQSPRSATFAVTSLLLAAALPLLSGCTDLEDPCPGAIFNSVEVTLEDPEGMALADATVTYEVLDLFAPETCRDSGVAGLYFCGSDQTGTFLIDASQEGYLSDTIEVEVELADERCGTPNTQYVTLVLEPEPEVL